MTEKRSIHRLRLAVVMWLWEEYQASYEEIGEVLCITRARVAILHGQAKEERERIRANMTQNTANPSTAPHV